MKKNRYSSFYKFKYSGFTLIELMVVVVIISILAAVAIPSYAQYVRRTQESKTIQEMLRMSQELERYKARNFNYAGFPSTTDNSTTFAVPNTIYTISIVDGSNVSKTLQDSTATGQQWAMKAIPTDTNYDALLMTSNGIRCKKTYLIASDLDEINAYTGCGASGSKPW